MSNTTKWTIGYQNEKRKKEIEKKYKSNTQLEERWKHFTRDATQNPYYHPKYMRIVKLKDSSYPEGTYRYRNDPIRVIYFPEGTKKIVYPLEVATTTDVSYKIKSRR